MLDVDRVAVSFLKAALGDAIGIAIGLLLWSRWARRERLRTRRRRKPMERSGRACGLEPVGQGVESFRMLPFHLFRRGSHGTILNPLAGSRDGRPVVVADYLFATDSEKPMRPKKRLVKLSIALIEVGTDWPHVRIEHQTLELRARDAARDDALTFESGEFNRRFAVRTDDRRFAYSLVDARMMAWLLDEGGAYEYEVNGPWVLVHGPQLPPAQVAEALDHALAFVARIPRVAWVSS